MNKLPYTFLVGCIIAGIVGFSAMESPKLNGLGKAVAGVFFILFFITYILREEKA